MDLRGYPGAVARLLLWGFLLLLFSLSVLVMYLLLRQQWHDGPDRVSSVSHRMPELDYALLWAAGRMAAAGEAVRLYDGPSFLAWREHLFGPALLRLDWIYPPPMILVGIGVAHLPLLPGYGLWMAVVCGLSAWVLRGAGLSWRVALIGLFGPPAWRGITSGQYAPLAASLVLAGLLQARRAPARAGLLVALSTLKPHLGILVPVIWLAQRRWVAFVTAAVTTMILAGAATAVLGPAIWAAFLHGGGASMRALLEPRSPAGYWVGAASVYWMARSFGSTAAVGYAMQFVAAVGSVAAVWIAARQAGETAAATVGACLIPLVSPYLYYSDLVGYSIVVAMLAERRRFDVLSVFLWLCPGIGGVFALFTGWQVLPVAVVMAAALAWQEFAAPAVIRADRERTVGSTLDTGLA